MLNVTSRESAQDHQIFEEGGRHLITTKATALEP
jgi:hypothetical protein